MHSSLRNFPPLSFFVLTHFDSILSFLSSVDRIGEKEGGAQGFIRGRRGYKSPQARVRTNSAAHANGSCIHEMKGSVYDPPKPICSHFVSPSITRPIRSAERTFMVHWQTLCRSSYVPSAVIQICQIANPHILCVQPFPPADQLFPDRRLYPIYLTLYSRAGEKVICSTNDIGAWHEIYYCRSPLSHEAITNYYEPWPRGQQSSLSY